MKRRCFPEEGEVSLRLILKAAARVDVAEQQADDVETVLELESVWPPLGDAILHAVSAGHEPELFESAIAVDRRTFSLDE
jgi:hypothetical protein